MDRAPLLSKEEQKQLRQQKDPNCESYASCGTRINSPITTTALHTMYHLDLAALADS